MEGLELDGAEGVLQQHHHELEVLHVAHVADHDLHVRPVQQDLAQQLRSVQGSRLSILKSPGEILGFVAWQVGG